jgi:hypothetical protein
MVLRLSRMAKKLIMLAVLFVTLGVGAVASAHGRNWRHRGGGYYGNTYRYQQPRTYYRPYYRPYYQPSYQYYQPYRPYVQRHYYTPYLPVPGVTLRFGW